MNRNLFAGRWVLPALVVGFILVAVAEVWLLTFVGSRIGALPTLGILLAEALPLGHEPLDLSCSQKDLLWQ